MNNQKKKYTNSPLVLKVPPNAKESEAYILGMILTYPLETLNVAKEILNVSDFYLDEHKLVFQSILDISSGELPDILLVFNDLKAKEKLDEVGGLTFLRVLVDVNPLQGSFRQHCLIIKQKSLQRQLISHSSELLEKSMSESEDIFDLLRDAENNISEINSHIAALKITKIENVASNVVDKFLAKVKNAKEGKVNPNEIYTGIKEWDDINGSLFGGVYVVAGRPGMGKGVHLTQLAINMGKNNPIGIINGEMTNEQLLTRIGCNLMGINNFIFKKKPYYVTDDEKDLVVEAMNETIKLNIRLEDKRRIDIIENKIRLWKKQDDIKCVLADFLTIFTVPPEHERYMTEVQKTNYVLNKFVTLSKELELPIILYAQMNREILGRHGKKEPNLADLKQSGSIEELAYQVSFLHRPEYYDPTAQFDENGEDVKGLMYQIIAKHRDGMVGKIKLKADLPTSRILDWVSDAPMGFKEVEEMPF